MAEDQSMPPILERLIKTFPQWEIDAAAARAALASGTEKKMRLNRLDEMTGRQPRSTAHLPD